MLCRYTGCAEPSRLFLSRFILRSPPGCYYTLYARLRRRQPTLHLSAWTTKSVSYQPRSRRVITPKPNFRFILSPRRLSTPLEIARRIYLFLFFPTPNFPSAITILSRHDHFHTTAFLRILLFLREKKKFCSSVNEPHTTRTLLRFASLNIAFHKLRVTAYTTVSNNRFIGLLIFWIRNKKPLNDAFWKHCSSDVCYNTIMYTINSSVPLSVYFIILL